MPPRANKQQTSFSMHARTHIHAQFFHLFFHQENEKKMEQSKILSESDAMFIFILLIAIAFNSIFFFVCNVCLSMYPSIYLCAAEFCGAVCYIKFCSFFIVPCHRSSGWILDVVYSRMYRICIVHRTFSVYLKIVCILIEHSYYEDTLFAHFILCLSTPDVFGMIVVKHRMTFRKCIFVCVCVSQRNWSTNQ